MSKDSNPLFSKVLIANRGEIALRFIKTANKLDITTVAIYSEADTNALHVRKADEAGYVGLSPATESYLNGDNIIKVALEKGAKAIFPGYGFLSENAKFAKKVIDNGIVWIGPSPKSIELMGDKITAKKIAQEAGVNTIPGYIGVIKDANQAVEIAEKIGFPVMLKAAAGGGGRGMRVAYTKEEVISAFTSATYEAKNSFSDDRIFIEKFITKPRHIEIQLLADKHGNALCLGERECSIQRRHQKVIEEAPSPFISEEVRQKMYEQVKMLAKKVDYYSTGTVEFIVDENQNFYFLEMNTRLQVEHCVTELVTGVDLVEQMILVAADKKLELTQDDIKLTGWAIESRICAEDPNRGFMPSSGRITEYKEPFKDVGIRIDSGVEDGDEVSMFYDAMISKLCTYAPTRQEAIEKMQNALGDYIIRGISHNISLLETVMFNERFIRGDLTTNFLQEEYPEGQYEMTDTSELTQIFMAVSLFIHLAQEHREDEINGQLDNRQRQIGTRWVVFIENEYYLVLIKPTKDGYRLRYEGEKSNIVSKWVPGNSLFQGSVNGRQVSVKIENIGVSYMLTHMGCTVKTMVRSPRTAELQQYMKTNIRNKKPKRLEAPLSGNIMSIRVKEGEEVKPGQDLVVIEAMKMENIITSDYNLTIKKIHKQEGDNINVNEAIMEFE